MGFFSRLFRSELPEASLAGLSTDIHSHLIPGIDDGAVDLEDSIRLIQGLQALGYKRLITTPHIMSDFYRNTPEIIRSGLETVRQELQKRNIGIQLDAAAEYYCDSAFERTIGEQELLTFNGRFILLELSYMNPSENFESVTFKLQMLGLTPILAHPERYPYWYHSFDRYAALRDKGIWMQINLASITGHYGSGPKRIAERLIDEGLVDLLGTDIHKVAHLDVFNKALKESSLHKLLDSGMLRNSELQ